MLGNIWKTYDLSPWQNNSINGIQIHNQSLWFKLMAIYLSKSPILIGKIKAQFTLAISKVQFTLATSKPISHWQNQSLILIGNIKAQFSLALFCQKRAQDYQYLGKNHGNHLIEKTHWELSWKLCSHIINPWNTWTSFASRHP